MSIDTGTAHHYIVHNRETAFAADPVSLTVLEATVGQHSCLVKRYSATIFGLGEVQLLRVEELPYRAIDDLVRRVTENVDNGVRRVQDVCLFGQIYYHKRHAFAGTLEGAYREW